MQKRISALLLAMIIVISSVLGGNTLKVKAASATVAMSPELAAEFYMVLLQITETAMYVSGANNGLDSKEALEAIGDGVQGYFTTNMSNGIDFEIQTTDGETFRGVSNSGYSRGLVEYTTADGQTYKLSGDKFTSLLLNGKITLDPGAYNDTDETDTDIDQELDDYIKKRQALIDAKKDEMMEAYIASKQGGGSGEDPTPSPEPSPDPKKLFTNIKLVSFGASLIAVAGAFVKDLFDGKVDGLDPDTYIPEGMFTGYPTESNAGNFVIDVSYTAYNNPVNLKYEFQGTDDSLYYFLARYGKTVRGTYTMKFGVYDLESHSIIFPYYGSAVSPSLGDYIEFAYNDNTYHDYNIVSNIPLFYNFAGYCEGDISQLLYAPDIYDFPDLVKSVPEVMQPLTGTKFSPSLLPGINTAVSNAVKSLPETSTDTKTNTETYKETMTSTITDVAPKTEVVPQPSTTPGTETGEGTDGESYKRDLKMLFPFCIPFDFIHLLQALSAEPETPKFEIPVKLEFIDVDTSFVIDLSWMDPIMKIWRLGELGLFIVMLMMGTRKVIKW